jgi:hypothetical protein
MIRSFLAAALSLGTPLCVVTVALAQTPPAYRLICQAFSVSTREDLQDRQGHALITSSTSCVVEGGLMNGGVITISGATEANGDASTVLVTSAITRKPGSVVMTVGETGKSTLVTGPTAKSLGLPAPEAAAR